MEKRAFALKFLWTFRVAPVLRLTTNYDAIKTAQHRRLATCPSKIFCFFFLIFSENVSEVRRYSWDTQVSKKLSSALLLTEPEMKISAKYWRSIKSPECYCFRVGFEVICQRAEKYVFSVVILGDFRIPGIP